MLVFNNNGTMVYLLDGRRSDKSPVTLNPRQALLLSRGTPIITSTSAAEVSSCFADCQPLPRPVKPETLRKSSSSQHHKCMHPPVGSPFMHLPASQKQKHIIMVHVPPARWSRDRNCSVLFDSKLVVTTLYE